MGPVRCPFCEMSARLVKVRSVGYSGPDSLRSSSSHFETHSRLPVRFPKEKARETSAIECQMRGHGCGVVVLKAIEQHITAEQDDCQQTISKIGRRSGPVIAQIRWIPVLANHPLSFLWSSLRVQLPRRLRTPWRVNSPYSWTQRSSRIR